MRTCSQCGRSGHNKRTCSGAAGLASTDGPAPAPRVKEEIDAETQEAIDWYLEQRFPGYIERQKSRAAEAEPETEEE